MTPATTDGWKPPVVLSRKPVDDAPGLNFITHCPAWINGAKSGVGFGRRIVRLRTGRKAGGRRECLACHADILARLRVEIRDRLPIGVSHEMPPGVGAAGAGNPTIPKWTCCGGGLG
jgi:hypothetical protein